MRKVEPVGISWEDVNLQVPIKGKVGVPCRLCRSWPLGSERLAWPYDGAAVWQGMKPVLTGVSGELKSGTITAIMVRLLPHSSAGHGSLMV